MKDTLYAIQALETYFQTNIQIQESEQVIFE